MLALQTNFEEVYEEICWSNLNVMIRRTRIARREFAEERRESIMGIWETEEEFEAEWRKEN